VWWREADYLSSYHSLPGGQESGSLSSFLGTRGSLSPVEGLLYQISGAANSTFAPLLSSRTSPFTVKNTLCGDTSTNGEFLQNLSLVDTLHHLSLHEAVNVGFANEFVKFIAISAQNKCCMATVNQTHVVARA
jgi:hypothetical protein